MLKSKTSIFIRRSLQIDTHPVDFNCVTSFDISKPNHMRDITVTIVKLRYAHRYRVLERVHGNQK